MDNLDGEDKGAAGIVFLVIVLLVVAALVLIPVSGIGM